MAHSFEKPAKLVAMQRANIIDHAQLGRWAVAARAGDMEATGALYNWLQPRLYAVALSMLGNSEHARDAVHDVFLIGLTRLGSLREPEMVSAWFRRIAQHLCYRRSAKAHPLRLLPEISDGIALDAMEDIIGQPDAPLHYALGKVPEKLRLTVLLRYFTEDNDYDTLAERLSIPVGTVRSRLSDAKCRMRQVWQDVADAVTVPPETEAWNQFYADSFGSAHFEQRAREQLMGHLVRDLQIVLTSKRVYRGRDYMEDMLADDIRYGTWYRPTRVTSSGALAVIDGESVDGGEHPDRCAPRTTFVVCREGDRAVRLHVYDSARPGAR